MLRVSLSNKFISNILTSALCKRTIGISQQIRSLYGVKKYAIFRFFGRSMSYGE